MANPIASLLPEWARGGTAVDPRTSPYFGRGNATGEAQWSLGSGTGAGYLNGLESLPGSEQFASGGYINPDALSSYLDANGYSLREANQNGQNLRWLQDAQGNSVIDPVNYATNDTMTELLTPVAMAVGGQYAFGGGMGGASAALPEALGEAGGYGFTSAEAAGAAPTALGSASSAGASLSLPSLGGSGGGNMDWLDAAMRVGSTLLQSNAASDAARTSAGATQAAIDEQRRQYDLNRGDIAPWLAAGKTALGQYQAELGKPTTAADVMADPGYQFALDQGQQALDRKFAAAGGRISGASMKAASRFNTGMATQGYGAAYQRGQDRLNRLAALANVGQTTAMGGASMGAQNANAIGQLVQSGGDTRAASQMAQGNIWGNGINSIAALYGRRNQGGMAMVNGGGYQNLPAYLTEGP